MIDALDILAPVDLPPAAIAQTDLDLSDAAPLCPADPVQDEDADLLMRLASNDEVAFRQLVERHIDRAFGIALRLLGSSADAEDVVQDTMLKVWTHRGQWEHGRAKFSTWLYRVVTNRCIDLHRRPRTDNVDAVPEPMDAQPDAISSMHRNEVTQMRKARCSACPSSSVSR